MKTISENLIHLCIYFIKQNEKSNELIYKNICSKSQFYRILNGESLPSFEIIWGFLNRIDFDITEYLPYIDYSEPEKAHDFFKSCEYELENRNFENVQNLIINNKLNHKSSTHYYLFLWYKIISEGYIKKEYSNAFHALKKIITDDGNLKLDTLMSTANNMIIFKYINSMSIFKFQENENDYALSLLKKAISHLKILQDKCFFDLNLYIELNSNLLKMQNHLGNHKEVLDIASEIIALQNSNKNLLLLGDVYYQKSIAHRNLIQIDEAKKCFDFSISYYEMLGLDTSLINDSKTFRRNHSYNPWLFRDWH